MLITPENQIARVILAALKVGPPMIGEVVELGSHQGNAVAHVKLVLPLLGERIVLVGHIDLRVTEHVAIRAVPTQSGYAFMAERVA